MFHFLLAFLLRLIVVERRRPVLRPRQVFTEERRNLDATDFSGA